MLWRRYRLALLWSVPIGVAIGCVLSLGLYLGGNPDYRSQGGWGAFAYLLGVGACVGGVTALSALIGGVLAVLLADRRLSRPPRFRVRGGAAGAAAGAAALWLAVGMGNALTSSTGAAWFSGFAAVAALTAAVSGAVALLLLTRAERAQPISQHH